MTGHFLIALDEEGNILFLLSSLLLLLLLSFGRRCPLPWSPSSVTFLGTKRKILFTSNQGSWFWGWPEPSDTGTDSWNLPARCISLWEKEGPVNKVLLAFLPIRSWISVQPGLISFRLTSGQMKIVAIINHAHSLVGLTTFRFQLKKKKKGWMSAYKMLFVAEAASFQPKGGSSDSVGKRKCSGPSLQNLHV